MKNYILSGMMALASIASASATQIMIVEEKVNVDGIIKIHTYEVAQIDSVIHEDVDSVKYVNILMKGAYNRERHTANQLNKIYFASSPDQPIINGQVVSSSNCKTNSNDLGNSNYIATKNDTIATYQYDTLKNTLKLKFISVMGDCCGEGWFMNTATTGDSIFITPMQLGEQSCNCVCRFDLTTELTNIKPQLYHFVERDNRFDIDLSKSKEGVILDRPKVSDISNSPCKNDQLEESAIDGLLFKKVKDGDTLAAYQFDIEKGTGVIVLYNLPYNCCVKLDSEIDLIKDTVRINLIEDLNAPQCDCFCTFDITTQVENLKKNRYIFVVNGLEFEVDLRLRNIGILEGVVLAGTRGMFSQNSPCKNELLDNNKGIDEEKEVEVPSRIAPRHENTDTLVSYNLNAMTGEGIIVSHNLMLNCCSQKGSTVTVKNDTISIVATEMAEDGMWCKCTCSYDISSKLIDLRAQKYHFIVDGTEFDVDLSQDSILSGIIPNGPRGMFVKNSPCKNEERAVYDPSDSTEVPDNKIVRFITEGDTIASYQYDPTTKECIITSFNLLLNCCSVKGSEVTINGDSITIKTTESGDEWCRCECTFDIITKVINLEPQKYHFNVDGKEFDVNFAEKENDVIIFSQKDAKFPDPIKYTDKE